MTFHNVKDNLGIIIELLKKIPEENWTRDSIEDSLITYLKAKELKIGDYLWPMRVSLSGQKNSPSPFDIAEIYGKEKTLKLIGLAIEKCS